MNAPRSRDFLSAEACRAIDSVADEFAPRLAGLLAQARADSAAPSITLTPTQSRDLVWIATLWNANRADRHLRRLPVAEVLSKILDVVKADVEAGAGIGTRE